MFDDVCLVCGRIADGLYCSDACKDAERNESALDIDLGFITDSLPPLAKNDHSTASSPTSSILTAPSATDDVEDLVLPDADALIPPTKKQSRSSSHSQPLNSARSPLLKPVTNLNFIRKPGPTNTHGRGGAAAATAAANGHGHSHSHSHHLQLPQSQQQQPHRTLHKRGSSHSHSSTSSNTATSGLLFGTDNNSTGHHHSRPQTSGRISHPHSSSSRGHHQRQGHASSSSSSSAHCSPDLQASSAVSRHRSPDPKESDAVKAKKKRSRASLPAYFSSILINPSTPVTALTMDTSDGIDDDVDANWVPKSIPSNSFSGSATIRFHPRPDSKRAVSDQTADVSAALASLTLSISTKKVQPSSFSPTTPTVRRVVPASGIEDELTKSGITRGRDRTERGRSSADGNLAKELMKENEDVRDCHGCLGRHKEECPRRIRFDDAVVPEHPLASDDEEEEIDFGSTRFGRRPAQIVNMMPSPPPSFRGRGGGVDMAVGGGRTMIMKLRRFSSPTTTSPTGRGGVVGSGKPRVPVSMFISPVPPTRRVVGGNEELSKAPDYGLIGEKNLWRCGLMTLGFVRHTMRD
ncbi:hypothetical protein FRC03_000009 [Tulasnella sp. 419]|nr:hypothetical protein FRC03_000009 [Tulasnella sp. 419]